MATQAQQSQLLAFLVGAFDAAPTVEIFAELTAAIDAGVSVDGLSDIIVGSDVFKGLYADDAAFVANFPTALVGDFVSAEVLADAEGVVAQWINEDGMSIAAVISNALIALAGVDSADETWGAAKVALENKVTVAQYYVDNVSGATLDLATLQGVLAGVTQDAATVTTAQASIDATANAGETFTLTTATAGDQFVGTAGHDTFNATQATYQTADVIIDSSSADNDVLNITTNTDITGKATVVGVENVNVAFSGFTAGGNTELAIAMDNVAATALNVTASGSTAVTSANITALANGTSVTTDATFASVTLTADDNAALTVNSTAKSATSTSTLGATATSGALTDLTVTESTGHSSVTASDMDGALVVTAAKDATVSAANATSATITSGEDVTVTDLTAAKTVSITAAKTVTAANDKLDGATTLDITAGGKVTVDADAAKTITLTAAGQDLTATGGSNNRSTLTSDALETLNVSGNGAALELNVTGADKLATLNVSGDQNVTAYMDIADIDGLTSGLTVANTGTGSTTVSVSGSIGASADLSKVATDTNLVLTSDVGNASSYSIKLADGATVTLDSAQGASNAAQFTAAADTNAVNFVVDRSGTSTSTYAIGDLTVTNVSNVSLDLSKDSVTAGTTLGTVDAGTNNVTLALGTNKLTSVSDIKASTLTITGSGDLTLADLTISELDASAVTGKVSYTVADGDVVRTGSADDTITAVTGSAIDMSVQTGAGNDKLTLAGEDYSAKTVVVDLGEGSLDVLELTSGANISGSANTITGFEKVALVGSGATATVRDTLLNGSSASFFGTSGTDTVTIAVTQATNDFSSLAIDTATFTSTDSFVINASAQTEGVTITGTDANDTITASNGVYKDTINGGEGNDTIIASQGGDVINGGSGTDTVNLSALKADNIEGGSSDSSGVVVNLSSSAVSAAAVAAATNGSFISQAVTSVAANTATYLFTTESSTNSAVVTTLSSIESVIGTNGADYIIGGSSAGTITAGEGDDVIALSANSAVEVIQFSATNGKDTITGFDTAEDKLSFDGMTGITATTATPVAAGATIAATLTDDTVYVFADGATPPATGSEVILDYTSLSDVADFLAEAFTATTAGDEAVFVINDLVGDKTYVYHFDESAASGADTISAAELTLVGVITEESGAALVAGDIA